MKIALLIILILTTYRSFAQPVSDSLGNRDNYIINTKAYKKGVYKTFEEFKYNNPSIVDNYIFDKKRLWLINPKTGKKKKAKEKDVWGLSDGERTFVRLNKYNEVLEMGRYCYFKEKGTRIIYGFYMAPLTIVPIPIPYKDEVIINFNTGKTFLLSKKLLKKILQTDDPELLTEFENERKKGKKLYEYIVKYNNRNTLRIK